METSQSIVNITKALLKAQKNIGFAVKGSKNPFFRSDYADLPSVMEACKEHLNDAGIFVMQQLDSTETDDYVVSTMYHGESGEFISSKMKLGKHTDIQKKMAEVTYLKRNMLQAQAFIPSLDDDDGNTASGKTEAPKGREPVKAKSESKVEVKPETKSEAKTEEPPRRRIAVPTEEVKPTTPVKQDTKPTTEQW